MSCSKYLSLLWFVFISFVSSLRTPHSHAASTSTSTSAPASTPISALTPASVPTSVSASACIQKFLNRYEKLQSYEGILTKKDYKDGELENNHILHVHHRKPHYLKVTYKNEGSNGIKNNGMEVIYDGSPDLKIKLGETRGLGFLIKGPASLLVGDTISITDSRVLDGEYFTINRAGMTPLSVLLKRLLPAAQNAREGGFSLREASTCKVQYRKHTHEVVEKTLDATSSIFDLEEIHGTSAYFLVKSNPEHFSDLHSIFHRKSDLKIRIPKSFFDFDLDLDETGMPRRILFYWDGKILGDYQYEILSLEEA